MIVLGAAIVVRGGLYAVAQPASNGDWSTYMHDPARSGFNPGEVRLSPDNAADLKLLWKQKLGSVLAAQPIVVGDTVYEGSWDGSFYALSAQDGAVKWKVNLGQTRSAACTPDSAGVTSAPAVTAGAIYVGGGDEYLYALDPGTGHTLWKFKTGDNTPEGGAYNWASPLLYQGRVYYGTAALCDKPFTHAAMWGVNAATGALEREAHFIPREQRGGGLWTSPTVDESTGAFFVTIGSGDFYIPYNYSIARLDPTSLAVADAWQIPTDVQVFDGDWGTTPTLFRDHAGALMVGAAAKNGYYYAFRADRISAGPAWQVRIADGGECPQCGEGSISSSAYAYDTVYAAGGYLSLGTAQKFPGTVHALDPSTGAVKWIHPTAGSVVPALAVANGLLVAVGEYTIEVMNAATGDLLWEYALDAQVYAAPSIADGVLYVASTDGNLYAFSAGPYAGGPAPYKVGQVGANPPPFTLYRKPVPAPHLAGAEQCFPETGKCARGDFLQFWRDRGGVERFGPAVTDELNEAGRTVQYFRNAVLELHPRQEGDGTEVRIGKLDFRLAYYRPTDENFDPAEPIP
ncbi:MAG: PQQ-binding-like beta-propeller repeat protein, partial [Chloroflexota bacterium]|nr:PQQ-binding-like beta-propeller repeat protein [Chloroflexota bacterium]